jgi:uncharacterized protein (TIGR03790 family)
MAALAWLVCAGVSRAQSLGAEELAVIYSLDDAASAEIAHLYETKRAVPAANVIGIHVDNVDVLTPDRLTALRRDVLARLPTNVQSLLLVWPRPYAAGCMSITTAFAAGYRRAFCDPGCGPTERNPLYDAEDWLPADTVGWWPAMLLPTSDAHLTKDLIARGVAADASKPDGTVYLIHTQDTVRNVRAANYSIASADIGMRIRVEERTTPVTDEIADVMGYFTGVASVDELPRLQFRPGAVADHLTSTGGVLYGGTQMSALAWLRQGASGSYGSVTEPCNHVEKFPNPAVLFDHYLHGDTLLESYWKSVAMPGQGLFIGEPLARPFAPRRR